MWLTLPQASWKFIWCIILRRTSPDKQFLDYLTTTLYTMSFSRAEIYYISLVAWRKVAKERAEKQHKTNPLRATLSYELIKAKELRLMEGTKAQIMGEEKAKIMDDLMSGRRGPEAYVRHRQETAERAKRTFAAQYPSNSNEANRDIEDSRAAMAVRGDSGGP